MLYVVKRLPKHLETGSLGLTVQRNAVGVVGNTQRRNLVDAADQATEKGRVPTHSAFSLPILCFSLVSQSGMVPLTCRVLLPFSVKPFWKQAWKRTSLMP